MKDILVIFGGISAEHEVSVVTGLQAFEKVDTTLYAPLAVYIAKDGTWYALPSLKSRKDFLTAPRQNAVLGHDTKGGFIRFGSTFGKTVYPYAAYLGLHGGTGEGGSVQGALETADIPFTSCGTEGSVIAMNKHLTKEVLRSAGVPVLKNVQLFTTEIRKDTAKAKAKVIEELSLPAIIKPAHLGSSIGITVAKSETDLERGLLEASFSDSEIVIEPFLEGITEFNCAVKRIGDAIITSPIERPISQDAILSFADKYERGGKKSGMASLTREIPAKIPNELSGTISAYAKKAFVACRLKGMARIDFMQGKDGTLYLTEINSIPGSMAFYLWEAAGISFTAQITELLEQAVADAKAEASRRPEYETDIIERFVKGA